MVMEIVSVPTKFRVIFHNYVGLPEDMYLECESLYYHDNHTSGFSMKTVFIFQSLMDLKSESSNNGHVQVGSYPLVN